MRTLCPRRCLRLIDGMRNIWNKAMKMPSLQQGPPAPRYPLLSGGEGSKPSSLCTLSHPVFQLLPSPVGAEDTQPYEGFLPLPSSDS